MARKRITKEMIAEVQKASTVNEVPPPIEEPTTEEPTTEEPTTEESHSPTAEELEERKVEAEKRNQELLFREAERVNTIRALLGKGLLIEAEIGHFLLMQKKDYERNLSSTEASKRFRMFYSTCGFKDMRIVKNRIAKYLILRKIPSAHHRILASYLQSKLLGILDALADCKRQNVLAYLAMRFPTIHDKDPLVISQNLDAWTRHFLGLDIKEGSTEEGSTEEGSTEEGSTEEGSTEEGSTEEGSTEEGSTEEGSTEEGSTEEGSSRKEGEIQPLYIETLDKLPSTHERAGIIIQHVKAFEGLLNILRALDGEELLENYIGTNGEHIATCLTNLVTECKGLSARIRFLIREKKVA